jgi:glycosyltransferase involved in cell wall biosynthesis
MNKRNIDLSVVIPVYNEETSIKPFLERAVATLIKMGVDYEIIFSMDPSIDNTEHIITDEIALNRNIKLLVFSRRFGQPSATIAGILESRGRYCAVIDVDLQDQPELLGDMYAKILDGYDVVYAKRRTRKGETLVKRVVASLGYWVINRLSSVSIPENVGDFRIISRRVIEELRCMADADGFLRGLIAYIGFPQTYVLYDRDERYSGIGNYNRFTGSIRIGLNGIVGFSSKPLFLMSILGLFFSLLGFIVGFWYLMQKILFDNLSPGLPTTIIAICFFSGLQLLGLGLIGEYIGRIYDAVKNRPKYIISKKINFD